MRRRRWPSGRLSGDVRPLRQVVVTGGTGVLGGALARGLARAGAKVGVLGWRTAKAADVVEEIRHVGGVALPRTVDVLDKLQLGTAREESRRIGYYPMWGCMTYSTCTSPYS